MSDLQELTEELMQDDMTQTELSKKTGISQADISRLENGTRNPSLSLLKRLADAMNTTLKIEFVPKSTQ